MPGGNPDLLPEQGYHAETGFSRAEKSIGTLPLNLSFNTEVYYGRLNNRILWIPGNTYWRAVNIGSVITAGLEAELELSKPYPNGRIWWRSRYLYNRTHTEQQPERQLIYVPANSAGSGLGFQFKSWKTQTWYSYTGFVFTATDHSAWLPAWGTLDIKLEKNLPLKKGELKIYLEARNILNVSYQVMENRPMPGRNYFAGIQWNFTSHKHK
jgi:iron complex outermembrane receptor protein